MSVCTLCLCTGSASCSTGAFAGILTSCTHALLPPSRLAPSVAICTEGCTQTAASSRLLFMSISCVSSNTCQSRGPLQGKHAKCLLACCQGCVVTAYLLLGSIRVHHASVFLCCRVLDSIKDNLRKEQSTVMEFNFLTMNKILSPIQVRHPQAYWCPVSGLVHRSVLSCQHYFRYSFSSHCAKCVAQELHLRSFQNENLISLQRLTCRELSSLRRPGRPTVSSPL